MCDLCSADKKEQQQARDWHLMYADRFEELATFYRQMARGILKPHSDDTKKVGLLARLIVRELVDTWI